MKILSLIPPRPDIKIEDFHDHWSGPHAEVVVRHPALRRYVQSHALAWPDEHLGRSRFAGVAEVWLDDMASVNEVLKDDDYMSAVQADEQSFIDQQGLEHLIATEEIVRDGPALGSGGSAVKLIQALRAAPGMATWSSGDDVALAARLGAQRHVRCHPVPDAYPDRSPPYDGVRELWWPGLDQLDAARNLDPEVWAALVCPTSIDPSASIGMVVSELRVIWP